MLFIAFWPDKDEFGEIHGKIWPWNETTIKVKGNQVLIEGVTYDIDEDFYDFYGKPFDTEKEAMEAAGKWLIELSDTDKVFQREIKKMGAL